jgi:hypothetical protein
MSEDIIERVDTALEGEVEFPSQKRKVFVGKHGYAEMVHWLHWVRPVAANIRHGVENNETYTVIDYKVS